jgi:hypothetical protein
MGDDDNNNDDSIAIHQVYNSTIIVIQLTILMIKIMSCIHEW